MTCIAYDGRTLAADKQMTYGEVKHTVTKIRRTASGHLIGGAGETAKVRQLVEWFERGADASDAAAAAAFAGVTLLVITPEGKPLIYFDQTPVEVHDRNVAIGCASELALMAMHLGKSAFEAVRLTCELSVHCGLGVDALELVEPGTVVQAEIDGPLPYAPPPGFRFFNRLLPADRYE